jgi:hypothetical protein
VPHATDSPQPDQGRDGFVGRLRAWCIAQWKLVVTAMGRAPLAIVALAALTTAVMYCSNNNLDAHTEAPRGDGQYRPVMARGDGHMHFLFTRSLVFDRDVNLDNDLAQFGDPWNQPITVTGRKNVMQQIGPSLVWAPVLAGADGAAMVANWFGADIQRHGYTLFHQRILFATSVLFAWLAMLFAIAVALKFFGGRWSATWAAVAALLGTSLTYYATYMPSYAHAMDAAACAIFLGYWALTYGDLRWRRAMWLGVWLGIATMVRAQDVLMGIVFALELGVLAFGARAQGIRVSTMYLVRGVLCLAVVAVAYLPQLYVWKLFYGSWITTPQGPGQMRYSHPMVMEFLFSSRNGWLSTHPIAYLGVVGLLVGMVFGRALGPRVRMLSLAMTLVIIGQVYTNAVTYEWWSGASFGQRRMCSVTLPIVIGIAIMLRLCNRLFKRVPTVARQSIAIIVLGYFVTWNLSWVGQLRHGASAGRNNTTSCCDDVPKSLKSIAAPIYRVLGNPFALPASAWFAWQHGVELKRWDRIVGNYPLVPGVLGYQDGSYRNAVATWNLTDDGGTPYLLGGYGPPQTGEGKRWRWTVEPRASALLPILMPEPHRITIPLFANASRDQQLPVVIRANGNVVADVKLGPGWTPVTFDTDGSVGENVIDIECTPRPYLVTPGSSQSPAALPSATPVGVAVGPWTVALPH